MTIGDNPSPNPKEWRLLSKQVRQSLVKELFLTSPQAEAFFADFDAIVNTDGGLPHLALVGQSGTGKTALAQRWLNLAARRATALYIPVGSTSLRSLLRTGLSQLGYPRSMSTGRESTTELATLLDRALKAAEKRVLVLDDVHLLVDWQAAKSLSPAADILPLSALMEVQLVLLGLPEETDFLLKAYPQQGRRVRTRHVLTPFRWDAPSANSHSPQETPLPFLALLDQIDQVLPLDWSGLSDDALASRLFAASDGFLDLLVPLIQQATYRAIEQDVPTLSLELLAKAYDVHIATRWARHGKPNPFASG